MSWIKTVAGDLINLEFVAKLDVAAQAEPEGGRDIEDSTHGVYANDADGDSECLFEGNEETCKAKLEQIAGKLPMVKP